MNFSNQRRLLLTVVAVLALMNLTILGVVWSIQQKQTKPSEHAGPPMGQGGHASFLERELGMTPEQSEAYRDLRDRHFEEVHEQSERIRKLKQELYEQFGAADSMRIQELTQAIGEEHAVRDRLTFWHFVQVREICDEKQQKRFDILIPEVLHRGPPENGPPGGRRPPRPRH